MPCYKRLAWPSSGRYSPAWRPCRWDFSGRETLYRDPRPVDGVRATGANRLQMVRFGILPQVLPVMLSHALYFLESNTRSATILGVVGAGGIGLQLADRIRVNNWDEVAFILIMILVAVSSIDLISKSIRHSIIQAGEASPVAMLASWQQNGSPKPP